MASLKEILVELGFKPHPSNKKHFWAGVVFGLLAFQFVRHGLDFGIWLSLGICVGSALMVGLGKEALDIIQRKKWDWLDLIYTFAGGVITATALLIIHALIRFS